MMNTFRTPTGATYGRAVKAAAASMLLIFAGASAADEIYRWVDDNGVVNFTQQKPRDAESEAIVTKTRSPGVAKESAVTAPAASSATGEPLSAEQEKMLEGLRAAEAARQSEIAKIRDQNCQQSRDVLARLTLKNRIRVRSENGEYTIMPEDERQQRISEAQQNIVRYCAPA